MFYDFPLIFKDGRAKQTDQREDSATKALPEPVLAGLGTSKEAFYCYKQAGEAGCYNSTCREVLFCKRLAIRLGLQKSFLATTLRRRRG